MEGRRLQRDRLDLVFRSWEVLVWIQAVRGTFVASPNPVAVTGAPLEAAYGYAVEWRIWDVGDWLN